MDNEWSVLDKAGEKLYNNLSKDGVELTGYGRTTVNENGKITKSKQKAIYLMLKAHKDLKFVPQEFEGFPVVVRVTGKIRPL